MALSTVERYGPRFMRLYAKPLRFSQKIFGMCSDPLIKCEYTSRMMCTCSGPNDDISSLHTPEDVTQPPIPTYQERPGETLEVRKARLLYQSRKRGILENDLLLSSFASRYLADMSEHHVKQYDLIINKPSNDWDIYYWLTGKQEVPEEFDNEVLHMMVEHSKNKQMENRTRMPDIHSDKPNS